MRDMADLAVELRPDAEVVHDMKRLASSIIGVAEAPTAAPTVPGFIPYDGDYSLATTQNHSCFGDATCPSAFQLGGGIKSSINASSIFLPSGLVELKMAITTTSSQDAQTSIVSVAVKCVPFALDDAQCQTPSCEQVSTFSATIDP